MKLFENLNIELNDWFIPVFIRTIETVCALKWESIQH